MANSIWITQYPVELLQIDEDNLTQAMIDENEFFELLRKQWKSMNPPSNLGNNRWEYDIPYGEMYLLGNKMFSFRHVLRDDWIIILLMLKDYLNCTLYLWSDSDPEYYLEIKADTTERDVLLWIDSQ